jgi:methyltransferase (TIGR00027 family)
MKDGPSRTALLVAAGVAFQSTHPRNRHLVPDEAGRLARAFVAAGGGRARSGASIRDRFIVALRERITVPGLTLHYVLRKRRIEQLVRAAIAAGYKQLIVIGAGLDTLALRLSSEINCVEIDHPATQQLKRDLAPGGQAGAALVYEPADLTKPFATSAKGATVFLAEAVLLYLSEEEVRAFLRALKNRNERTRLIFTFWEPRDPINFQNATWIADWWLRRHGEPGRWAIAPESLGRFLESEGFTLREVIRDVDYETRSRGEHIAVAELTP